MATDSNTLIVNSSKVGSSTKTRVPTGFDLTLGFNGIPDVKTASMAVNSLQSAAGVIILLFLAPSSSASESDPGARHFTNETLHT